MPDIQSLDLSLQKTFKIRDVQVTLVAEGFNLTNHENVTAVSTAEDNHGEPTAFDVTRTFRRFRWISGDWGPPAGIPWR
jgi:hypothetical protein